MTATKHQVIHEWPEVVIHEWPEAVIHERPGASTPSAIAGVTKAFRMLTIRFNAPHIVNALAARTRETYSDAVAKARFALRLVATDFGGEFSSVGLVSFIAFMATFLTISKALDNAIHKYRPFRS